MWRLHVDLIIRGVGWYSWLFIQEFYDMLRGVFGPLPYERACALSNPRRISEQWSISYYFFVVRLRSRALPIYSLPKPPTDVNDIQRLVNKLPVVQSDVYIEKVNYMYVCFLSRCVRYVGWMYVCAHLRVYITTVHTCVKYHPLSCCTTAAVHIMYVFR